MFAGSRWDADLFRICLKNFPEENEPKPGIKLCEGTVSEPWGMVVMPFTAIKYLPDFFDWNLIALTDAKSTKKLNNPMCRLLFLSGCLESQEPFCLVEVSIVISHYLTRPIFDLQNAMLEIRNNRLGVTIPNGYQDEIGELIQGFNEMSSSLESLVEKNKMITALQKEAG
ncbi:MAG: HAMP domain-containing protein [Lachnospiraceae bacterium]